MTGTELDLMRYPIGKFVRGTKAATPIRVAACTALLEAFPDRLHNAVRSLSEDQLDTPYRPGGWTVRQLVHHIADSHMNALIRFKWALSEDTPAIKAYLQDRWAEQTDARTMPIAPSLSIIAGVHARWGMLLTGMSEQEMERAFVHPEQNRQIVLAEALEQYVWHGAHHLAHITGLKERMGL